MVKLCEMLGLVKLFIEVTDKYNMTEINMFFWFFY